MASESEGTNPKCYPARPRSLLKSGGHERRGEWNQHEKSRDNLSAFVVPGMILSAEAKYSETEAWLSRQKPG